VSGRGDARHRGAGHRDAQHRDAQHRDADHQALTELFDLLSRRHALDVFWWLRGSSDSFATLVSRLSAGEAQLSQRLRELRQAGIVEIDEAGDYRLTAYGRRLQGLVEPLAGWALEWSRMSPRQREPRGAANRGRGERER
jgi:DNA-binding HxlR family transcriptional regulator